MSYQRRSSVKRQDRDIKYGPNGRRLCRFCSLEVKPPRKTICSEACVHEWKLRSDSKYLRRFIYERDLGRCATCGIDTRWSKIKIEDIRKAAQDSDPAGWMKSVEYTSALKSLNITHKESLRSMWEADHIVAVSVGGGECGLDKFQSLCKKCHKVRSKIQARERAALKKK